MLCPVAVLSQLLRPLAASQQTRRLLLLAAIHLLTLFSVIAVSLSMTMQSIAIEGAVLMLLDLHRL